jgi:hypothetical protein
MIKNNIAISLILILISSIIFGQTKIGISFYSGGHDSLLFDGADNENSIFLLNPADEKCKIRVGFIIGEAFGTQLVDTVEKVCGVREHFQIQRTGQLKEGDYLAPGTEINMPPLSPDDPARTMKKPDRIVVELQGQGVYITVNRVQYNNRKGLL